jgi:hypothetical protein
MLITIGAEIGPLDVTTPWIRPASMVRPVTRVLRISVTPSRSAADAKLDAASAGSA